MPTRTNGRLPRRRTDRIEDAAAWVLSACLLLMAAGAMVLGLSVHDTVAARAKVESSDRVAATAVLTADAPVVTSPVPADIRMPAPAVWLDPAGNRHTGRVDAPEGAAAGTALPVWLDRSGRLVSGPPSDLDAVFAGVAAAGILVGGGVFALGFAWLAVQYLTGLCNAAAWERDWARVGPVWRRGDARPGGDADRPRTG